MSINQKSVTDEKSYGLLVILARMMWFFIGPAALLVISIKIITDSFGWFSRLDVLYAVFALLTILGRWYEQKSGFATDCNGNPTTQKDCTLYIVWFIAFALILWTLLRIVGIYILK